MLLCFKWQYKHTKGEIDEGSHSRKFWKGRSMKLKFFSIENDIQRGFKWKLLMKNSNSIDLGNIRNLGNILLFLPRTRVRVCLWVYVSLCAVSSSLVFFTFPSLFCLFPLLILPLNRIISYLLYGWNSLLFPLVKRNISYLFLWEWNFHSLGMEIFPTCVSGNVKLEYLWLTWLLIDFILWFGGP